MTKPHALSLDAEPGRQSLVVNGVDVRVEVTKTL